MMRSAREDPGNLRARTPGHVSAKDGNVSLSGGSGDEAGNNKRVCKGRTRELAVIHPKFTQESGLHMSSEIETSRGKMVIQHLTNQENSNNVRPSILENCAHFHYEYAEIGPIQLELRDESATSTGSKDSGRVGGGRSITSSDNSMMYLIRAQTLPGAKGGARTWVLRRTLEDLESLDKQLHTCVYDRKYSRLPVISQIENINSLQNQEICVDQLVASYLSRLGELVCPLVTCGPVLSWLEIDNKGNRYIISDDSDINTPAVAAAYAIKKYTKQAQDEISFQVGDMISVIDMPEPEESVWWRGKRGFDVGFFPCDCVEIIGDKVPSNITNLQGGNPATHSQTLPHLHRRNSTQSDSPSEPTKPVLRKHGKLITFFRSFILSRPARGKLKKRGILKERVFGCDLGEHLLNSGQDVPKVLVHCAEFIEKRGIVDGIYRLSGISSNIQRLRVAFDEDRIPNLYEDKQVLQDIHSVSSLLKMYFRELPNPVCTFHLYDQFVAAAKSTDDIRLSKLREVVFQLPPPNYRTLEYLSRHLYRVASKYHDTGMTPKNVAIVWAPNLLRCKQLEVGGVAALQGVGIQAVVTEYLIKYCDLIFTDTGCPPTHSLLAAALSPTSEITFTSPLTSPASAVLAAAAAAAAASDADSPAVIASVSGGGVGVSTSTPIKSRPKSLALTTPSQLRVAPPTQKYIDVGGGPANLPPTYHTIIQLPGGSFKHKKSSTPWKNIFFKDKKKMDRKVSSPSMIRNLHISQISTLPSPGARALRPVRSAENLAPTPPSHVTSPLLEAATGGGGGGEKRNSSHRNSKESDELGPLELVASALDRHGSPKSHNRSSSHDSYFERKMSVQFQLENNDLHTSNLDISEIQVNFEQEDHEMKILSEDETMISTSVGSEVSLRSPLEEIPRQNPRGNSPMRYRGGEVIRGGGSPTKTRRLSFKEKFRKFTSPTLNRKHGDSPPIISPPPPTASDAGTTSSVGGTNEPEEKSFKELLVTALSPESLRRKSVDRPTASNGERTVRGGVGGRVTGKTSPLKKKVEARSSPQSDTAPVKRTKLERDSDKTSMKKDSQVSASHELIVTSATVLASGLEDSLSAKDFNDPSLSFSPSIRFIDASSSYELVSDSDEISDDKKFIITTTVTSMSSSNVNIVPGEVVSDVGDKGGENIDVDGHVLQDQVLDDGCDQSRSPDELVNQPTKVAANMTQNSSQNDLQDGSVEVVEADVHMNNLEAEDENLPNLDTVNSQLLSSSEGSLPNQTSVSNMAASVSNMAVSSSHMAVSSSNMAAVSRPVEVEVGDVRKDSLRSDSEYVLASPRTSEDGVSLATSSSRKPSTTRSDWSYSMAGATVSDNESFSLVTSSLEDRPITSASEDQPISSPLSEDMGVIVGAEFEVAAVMTEHLTDTTTDSITEKCDSLTLRESMSEVVRGAGLYLQQDLSSQESLQQDFTGASHVVVEDDNLYTAKLVPATGTEPSSLPASHTPSPLAVSASTTSTSQSKSTPSPQTRGAVLQTGNTISSSSGSHDQSSAMADDVGSSVAVTPQTLLLQSPVYEGVTLRRSPVTSPSRNRSVRSDFILNLVQQQGISSQNEQMLVSGSGLQEICEEKPANSTTANNTTAVNSTTGTTAVVNSSKPVEMPTTSSLSQPSCTSKSSPTHKLSGSTLKAMMPQPYNQSKQFKRFSVEETEVTPANSKTLDNNVQHVHNDRTSIDKSPNMEDDQTVESFGSVQALNLDTSEEDIQLETKDINQSQQSTCSSSQSEKSTGNQSQQSTYIDVQSQNSTCQGDQSEVRMDTGSTDQSDESAGNKMAETAMSVDEVGSYYVSVSHLSLNTSSDDKGVQMTGAQEDDDDSTEVQSPGTVGTAWEDVSTAKPPKTPKTSSRFDRERSLSTQDPASSSSPMEEATEFQWRSSSRRSSTRSRDSLNKSRDSFDQSRDRFNQSRDSFDQSRDSFDRSRDSLEETNRSKRSSSREEPSGKRTLAKNSLETGLQNGFRSSNGSLEHGGSCLMEEDAEVNTELEAGHIEFEAAGGRHVVLEPEDGRRSAHELSQTEKRKSNRDRFQGGGKRVSRSVGAKSSTLSLHTTKTGCTLEGEENGEGEEGTTPLLQRRNSIHIIPYVDVNDPETRCRMERYKEERRSILRSKYKAEDYLSSERKSESVTSTTSCERTKKISTSSSHDAQDELLTYKKVPVIDDSSNEASTTVPPQRPDNLDLEAVKPSPRLSLKIYECKAGSSEFVEKTGEHAGTTNSKEQLYNKSKTTASTTGILKADRNQQQQQQPQPPSPVTLRQKPVEMRKLVDLKQPEPNGLWRRGGEERASDRKTWGSLRVSPRRTTDGGEERPNSSIHQAANTTTTSAGHVALSARNSSPAISKSSIDKQQQPNYGTIDESVNVKERASIFGPRTSAGSCGSGGGLEQPIAKLRTVSVVSAAPPPVKERTNCGVSADAGKQRALSVGESKRPPVVTGSATVTSPNKIKNMAALFEQNVK